MRRAVGLNGQSLLEYAILVSGLILAGVAMTAYVKYAFAGRLKAGIDGVSQELFKPDTSYLHRATTRMSTIESKTDGSTTTTTATDQSTGDLVL